MPQNQSTSTDTVTPRLLTFLMTEFTATESLAIMFAVDEILDRSDEDPSVAMRYGEKLLNILRSLQYPETQMSPDAGYKED